MFSNKYDINFEKEDVNVNIQRLTNQLWKLIPMRENEEDWQKQIETVIVEITGMNEIFLKINLLPLLSKLEGIKLVDLNFDNYRKTVFECINLLRGSCK